MIKKGIIIFLVFIAFLDLWKQTKSCCLTKSQAVFKQALIESGISVD